VSFNTPSKSPTFVALSSYAESILTYDWSSLVENSAAEVFNLSYAALKSTAFLLFIAICSAFNYTNIGVYSPLLFLLFNISIYS